jgi:regulator of sigma E protease
MEGILSGIGTAVVTLLMISVLLSAHELGHFLTAKRAGIKVEEFGFGFPPRIWGTRRGETDYSINLIPFACFVRMAGEDDPSVERSFAAAKKRWRAAVLFAGPLVNILMAVVLFACAFMVGFPTATEVQVEVAQVMAQSPAEQAGLQTGDIILSVDGQPITDGNDMRTKVMAHAGEPVSMMVKRGEDQYNLTITPRKVTPANQGPIGIAMQEKPLKIEHKSYDPVTALWMGAKQTWNALYMTVTVPAMIIRGQIPAELARPTGIVGIYQITSQATTASVESGWGYPVFSVLGLLSAGLGLANLFPIPGLDGGRLLFLAIEVVRRKRIKPEREAVIHFAGLMLLFGLMAVLIYMDVLYPMAPIDWTP